jgi:hypothetical protein
LETDDETKAATAFLCAAFVFGQSAAALAADEPGTLTHRFSFPQRAATKAQPQVIDLVIDVKGKPVPKRVMVTDTYVLLVSGLALVILAVSRGRRKVLATTMLAARRA